MTAIHLYAKIKVGVSLVNISIAITQPRILRFRSNLVQTLIAWQPMYNRRLRLIFNGQDHSVKTSSSFSVNQGRWIQWRCQNLDRKLQNTVCVYMRSTKLAKTAQSDWRDLGRYQVAMHSQLPHFVHCVSKHIPDVFSYNSRKHCRIFLLFGRHITEKVRNQKMLYFSTSPN